MSNLTLAIKSVLGPEEVVVRCWHVFHSFSSVFPKWEPVVIGQLFWGLENHVLGFWNLAALIIRSKDLPTAP